MNPTPDELRSELDYRYAEWLNHPRRDGYRYSNNKPRIWEGVRRSPSKLLVWIALGAASWFALAVGFNWVKHLAGRVF